MDINVRLLVHAGASSTRQDDDRHAMQAAAYLDLESTSATRTHLIWRRDLVGGKALPVQDAAPHDDTTEVSDSTTFIDDTQLAYTLLESQLIPSSARILRQTSVKRRSYGPQISSTAPATSTRTRLSESTLLSPALRDRSSGRVSVIEAVEIDRDHPSPNIDRTGKALNQHSQPKSKEKTQSTEATVTTNDTTSELPASYSLGDHRDGTNERPQLSERSINDPGPSPATRDKSHGGSLPVRSQEIGVREQQQPAETTLEHIPPHKPVARDLDATRSLAEDPAASDVLRTVDACVKALSLSIQPGGPSTSVKSFTTHVTPALLKLAQNPDLAAAFVPTAVERGLGTHERGHWEVQCSNWDPDLQLSFWRFLEGVVGTGKAGWGVWCTRGPEIPLCSQSSQPNRERLEQVTEPAFGPVRVYCWGEIAKHIYLLLFVASNSKVRKLGLRWIDARGMVVVQMRDGRKG